MSGGARDQLAAYLSRWLAPSEMVEVAKLINEIDHHAYAEGHGRGFEAGIRARAEGDVRPVTASQAAAAGSN